jgi:hypothetical protein
MVEVEDAGERGGLTGAAGVWSVHTMTPFACFRGWSMQGGREVL